MFFVVRKLFVEREKEKNGLCWQVYFFDIERSIENLKTGGVKLQRDMSVSKQQNTYKGEFNEKRKRCNTERKCCENL